MEEFISITRTNERSFSVEITNRENVGEHPGTIGCFKTTTTVLNFPIGRKIRIYTNPEFKVVPAGDMTISELEQCLYGNPLYKGNHRGLSVRAWNCLVKADIKTVFQLFTRSEIAIQKIRNLGKTTLDELKELGSDAGLHFGMTKDEIESTLNKLPF